MRVVSARTSMMSWALWNMLWIISSDIEQRHTCSSSERTFLSSSNPSIQRTFSQVSSSATSVLNKSMWCLAVSALGCLGRVR